MEALKEIVGSTWFSVALAIGGVAATIDTLWKLYRAGAKAIAGWRQKTQPRRAASTVVDLAEKLSLAQLHLTEPSIFIAEIFGEILRLFLVTLLALGLFSLYVSLPETIGQMRTITLGIVIGTLAQVGMGISKLRLSLKHVRDNTRWAKPATRRIASQSMLMDCPAEFQEARATAQDYLIAASDGSATEDDVWIKQVNLLASIALKKYEEARRISAELRAKDDAHETFRKMMNELSSKVTQTKGERAEGGF